MQSAPGLVLSRFIEPLPKRRHARHRDLLAWGSFSGRRPPKIFCPTRAPCPIRWWREHALCLSRYLLAICYVVPSYSPVFRVHFFNFRFHFHSPLIPQTPGNRQHIPDLFVALAFLSLRPVICATAGPLSVYPANASKQFQSTTRHWMLLRLQFEPTKVSMLA